MKATTYTVPRLLIYAYNCMCAYSTLFFGQFCLFFFDLIIILSPVICNFTKIENSLTESFSWTFWPGTDHLVQPSWWACTEDLGQTHHTQPCDL